MKTFLALFLSFAAIIGVTAIAADTTSKQVSSNDLVTLLPASDAVMTLNMKRLLSDGLPQLLTAQPQQLAQLNAGLDDFKTKTGIDLRSFDQVAIGGTFQHGPNKKISFEPLALVRGTLNVNGLIAVGKLAANGKFRQETIGGKTVYVFNWPAPAVKDGTQNNLKDNDSVDKFASKMMSGEIAVVAVDANTFAVAKPQQIRSMLTDNSKSRISTDLTKLVNRNPNAIVNFAGNVPADAVSLANTGNDQIDKILGSLRQVFGSADLNDGNASMTLAASTAQAAQAEELESTLIGLQTIGKGFLGSKNDEKTQIAARALENLKITRTQNEVQMQTALSQSDLNKLMGGIK